MNKVTKIIVVVALIIAVGIVIAVKQQESSDVPEGELSENQVAISGNTKGTSENSPADANDGNNTSDSQEKASLPLLLDLGSKSCVPCKMMEPILEEFKNGYNDEFRTQFIDVRENPQPAREYNIRVIPTQIFFDANGNELFRHEGFYSKEDILSKWKQLGFEVEEDESN